MARVLGAARGQGRPAPGPPCVLREVLQPRAQEPLQLSQLLHLLLLLRRAWRRLLRLLCLLCRGRLRFLLVLLAADLWHKGPETQEASDF